MKSSNDGLVRTRLRELREERRLPQWIVAAGSGVDPARLSIIERGFPPRESEVAKMTKYYGLASEDIWPER